MSGSDQTTRTHMTVLQNLLKPRPGIWDIGIQIKPSLNRLSQPSSTTDPHSGNSQWERSSGRSMAAQRTNLTIKRQLH